MREEKEQVFWRTMGFIAPYKWLFSARIALTVLNAVMGLVASYGSSLVIRAAQERSVPWLWKGTAVLAASLIVEALSVVSGAILMSRVSFGSLKDIRNQIVSRLMKAPVSFFAASHTGDISSRMTSDVSVLQQFISGKLTVYLYYPVRFFAAICFMLPISVKLTAACCAAIPFSVYFPRFLLARIESRAASLQQGLGEVNVEIQEAMAGAMVTKIFGGQKQREERFEQKNQKALEDSKKLTGLHAWMGAVGEVTRAIPVVICVLYGAVLCYSGELEFYQFSFFLMSLGFLVEPVARIPDMLEAWKKTKGAAARVLELLDKPREPEGQVMEEAKGAVPVEAENLSFAYEKGTAVLKGISLEGKKGCMTAIVGESGCGKSTLLWLLAGFYADYEGSVKLFGRELRDWNLEALRSRIGFVFQEPFLFPGTIYENIAAGRPGASREEVEEAAKKADAHEFILGLEKGYETRAGERGSRLSGGQRQRITIARAFLKDAPLLLMDEPTSALDEHAQQQVQKALERLMEGKTVFVVAHRMSTILQADQILVLKDGKILDRGRHGELLERCSWYRQLYEKETAVREEI